MVGAATGCRSENNMHVREFVRRGFRVLLRQHLRRDLVLHPLAFSRRARAELQSERTDSWGQIRFDLAESRLRDVGIATSQFAGRVADSFSRNGSDKATKHSYHLVYAPILDSIGGRDSVSILEVGVGTSDVSAVSSMGSVGIPGASLQAWRELAVDAEVIGADIDEGALLQARALGFECFRVDQRSIASLAKLVSVLGPNRQFDLIVDDGLHTPRAAIRTFEALSGCLAREGIYVIEDIKPRDLPDFHLALSAIAPTFVQVFASLNAETTSGQVVLFRAGSRGEQLLVDTSGDSLRGRTWRAGGHV